MLLLFMRLILGFEESVFKRKKGLHKLEAVSHTKYCTGAMCSFSLQICPDSTNYGPEMHIIICMTLLMSMHHEMAPLLFSPTSTSVTSGSTGN